MLLGNYVANISPQDEFFILLFTFCKEVGCLISSLFMIHGPGELYEFN